MSTKEKPVEASEPPASRALSRSTVERLYSYYLLAKYAKEQGNNHISSRNLAEYLFIGDTQVRKDMAAINLVGAPKRGYELESLLAALRRTMGVDQVHRTVLCGVGNLGTALLRYSRFAEFGFRLAGAFDVRDEVIGQEIAGAKVLHVSKLPDVIKIFEVEIGILTVNMWAAQDLADTMVGHGVRAIWNFTPIHLKVPDYVVVRHEDFAGSLAFISHYLRHV